MSYATRRPAHNRGDVPHVLVSHRRGVVCVIVCPIGGDAADLRVGENLEVAYESMVDEHAVALSWLM